MEPDRVFGDVAERYDRCRPEYPAAAVDAVLGAAPKPWRALECGAGTGKATRLFAARGVAITAVEPDPRMAAHIRAGDTDTGIEVVVGRFEDAEIEPGAYTIGIAAQSWHWVEPALGTAQMARALHPGGVLALMWNGAAEDRTPVRLAIESAYERHAPGLVEASVVNRRLGRDHTQGPLATSRWFAPLAAQRIPWIQRYTTAEYVELLDTHSDHRSLPDDVRAALLADVAAAVEDHGGHLDYRYETDLVTYRRTEIEG